MLYSKGLDIGFLGGLSDFRSNFWPGLGGLNSWTNFVVIAVLSFQFGGLALQVKSKIYDRMFRQYKIGLEGSDLFENTYLAHFIGTRDITKIKAKRRSTALWESTSWRFLGVLYRRCERFDRAFGRFNTEHRCDPLTAPNVS